MKLESNNNTWRFSFHISKLFCTSSTSLNLNYFIINISAMYFLGES